MGGSGDGGRKKGGGGELIETVLTCEGNYSDPHIKTKLQQIASKLQRITHSGKWVIRKIEPWNSVRVTFSIPREAAERLHLLAEAGDEALRQLGILSVQVHGDQVISLKVSGPNNEPTEIILRTDEAAASSDGAQRPVAFGSSAQKSQPIPQFRSPAVASTSRQGYLEGVTPQRSTPSIVQGSTPAVLTQRVAARPSFPTNPPPPYPGPSQERASTSHKPPVSPVVTPAPNPQIIRNPQSQPFRCQGPVVTTSTVPHRNIVRGSVNMVKNSPLLVGLLQSPEQNTKSTKLPISTSAPVLYIDNPVQTTPVLVSSSSVGTLVRSRDGTATLQQIYSGGSVINSIPSNNITSSKMAPPAYNQSVNASRVQQTHPESDVKIPAVQIKEEPGTTQKKDSQYLINPNTGLLEPRPTTDSSDSESEIKSPKDEELPKDHISKDVPSHKESPKESSWDSISSKESSSWENSGVQKETWENIANSGEKIKLRLKLGKEEVAQTTLPKKTDKRIGVEPKIPKLHIKLHSSQPVIVNPVDDKKRLKRTRRPLDIKKKHKEDDAQRRRDERPRKFKKLVGKDLGEIASHKIMENLPPSITKVADLHAMPNSVDAKLDSVTDVLHNGEIRDVADVKLKQPEASNINCEMRKDPEGLGSVQKYLNSSIQINKLSSPRMIPNCSTSYRPDDKKNITKDFPKSDTKNDVFCGIKPKTEKTVGRVTCVDVMDRKALEEALKTSRSVKKMESKGSNMDRLWIWNSIDVPLPHSQATCESTNLLKAKDASGAKGGDACDKDPSACVNSNNCDSSVMINYNHVERGESETLVEKAELKQPLPVKEPDKETKVDVESPEGTPKGDHGNGQGGEDSGIESMDALSEKSPNHVDQSPNRRDEKDCDLYPVKSKDRVNGSALQSSRSECNKELSSVSVQNLTNSTKLTPVSSSQSLVSNSTVSLVNSISSPNRETIPSSTSSIETIPKLVSSSTLQSNPKSYFGPQSQVKIQTATKSPLIGNSLSIASVGLSDKPIASQAVISTSSFTSRSSSQCVMSQSNLITSSFPQSSLINSSSQVNSSNLILSGSHSLSSLAPLAHVSSVNCQQQPSTPLPTAHSPHCPQNSSPQLHLISSYASNQSQSISNVQSHTSPSQSSSNIVNLQVQSNHIGHLPKPHISQSTISSHSLNNVKSVNISQPQNVIVTSSICTLVPSLQSISKPFVMSNSSSPLILTSSPSSQVCTTVINTPSPSVSQSMQNSTTLGLTSQSVPAGTLPSVHTVPVTTNTMSLTNSNIIRQKYSSCSNGVAEEKAVIPVPCSKPSLLAITLTRPHGGGIINSKYAASLAKSLDNNQEKDPSFVSNPTMIILATTASSVPSAATITNKVCVAPSKVVAVKPGTTPAISTSINTKHKTYRLVALPSVSATPIASQVKEQLLTLKPIPKTPPEDSKNSTEDLDFVGFSAKEEPSDPTPVRVRPPLYTYGGTKERKKEVENEEEKDTSVTTVKAEVKEERDNEKIKDKMNLLTIEIPPVETPVLNASLDLPDDKRLTRTTRQSARLCSPKVGDLSPQVARSPVIRGSPSPAPRGRGSPSPAPRGVKRGRHESESSNASSVSEDQDLLKVQKRKCIQRDKMLKNRNMKPKDENKGESSDEEGRNEQSNTVNNFIDENKKGNAAAKDGLRRTGRMKPAEDVEDTREKLLEKEESKDISKIPKKPLLNKKDPDSDNIRMKTRSAANNAAEDVPCKRRRLSKEK